MTRSAFIIVKRLTKCFKLSFIYCPFILTTILSFAILLTLTINFFIPKQEILQKAVHNASSFHRVNYRIHSGTMLNVPLVSIALNLMTEYRENHDCSRECHTSVFLGLDFPTHMNVGGKMGYIWLAIYWHVLKKKRSHFD